MPVIFCELGFGSCLYGYWLLLLTNAIYFIVNDLVKLFKQCYLLVIALNRYYLVANVATDYTGAKARKQKNTHTQKKTKTLTKSSEPSFVCFFFPQPPMIYSAAIVPSRNASRGSGNEMPRWSDLHLSSPRCFVVPCKAAAIVFQRS